MLGYGERRTVLGEISFLIFDVGHGAIGHESSSRRADRDDGLSTPKKRPR
jgi:hypothetical protein